MDSPIYFVINQYVEAIWRVSHWDYCIDLNKTEHYEKLIL